MLLLFFPALFTIVYISLLLYFITGARRLYQKPGKKSSEVLSSISVIVPLRNEQASVQTTLEALANQDYKGNWEVICVDDRSTDNTRNLLEKFCSHKENFIVTEINKDLPNVTSPKKRALEKGFSLATGEVIMTTDADCTPPPGWISSMEKNFTKSIGIVQGPKKISGPSSILTNYQKLEVFGFVSVEAVTFAMGKPMLASAPSLAYRKSLFIQAKGFSGLEHLVSGDDDMLVHKMTQFKEGKVRYNVDSKACVATPPVYSWRALLQQRSRWASNGAHYANKSFIALLSCVFFFYVWLVVSPFMAYWNIIPWFAFFLPLTIKYILEYFFLTQTAIKFKQKRLLRYFIWAALLHIPITVIAVIRGNFGWYKWK